MVELAAVEACEGLERSIGELTLAAIRDRALVSMAFPVGARDAVSARVLDRLGTALPRIGRCEGDDPRLIGLQRDQVWCAFEQVEGSADGALAERLGADHGVRLTDQSGGWVQLRLSGAGTIAVLERLCPLDLHERTMPVGSCARTVMEHLGTVLVRDGPEDFELLTARSSAQSFAHALENAAGHVVAERSLPHRTGH